MCRFAVFIVIQKTQTIKRDRLFMFISSCANHPKDTQFQYDSRRLFAPAHTHTHMAPTFVAKMSFVMMIWSTREPKFKKSEQLCQVIGSVCQMLL